MLELCVRVIEVYFRAVISLSLLLNPFCFGTLVSAVLIFL